MKEIDPVLRRRAVPTAMKALGISTGMAAVVGSIAAACLIYAVEGELDLGNGDVESTSEEVQVSEGTVGTKEDHGNRRETVAKPESKMSDEDKTGRTLRQFLTDSFRGGSSQ